MTEPTLSGLSKLFWAKDSTAEMQLTDVRNLLSSREQLLSRPGAERVVMGSRMFDVARNYLPSLHFRLAFLRLKQSVAYASGFMATKSMSRLTPHTLFN